MNARHSFFALLFLLSGTLFAQQPAWISYASDPANRTAISQDVTEFQSFSTDWEGWRQMLDRAPKSRKAGQAFTLSLPDANGELQRFRIWQSSVMHPDLAARYPEIRSFTGQGVDEPRAILKLDLNPTGLHAMVFAPQGDWALEPMYRQDRDHYMSFRRQALNHEEYEFSCAVDGAISHHSNQRTEGNGTNPTGTQLRTYRLAMSATGEYTTFHGGSKAQALAAIVVTMNRVNGIYERDFTVTMTLVPNTDTLIFTNPTTDPFSNNNLGDLLGENQNICDSLIGPANYDVGHIFGTAGGGLAGLGVVCGGSKAIGATGLSSPVGDFFDVDYVSHEFGHQYSGNHTFNDCGSPGPQPYEPGSGVTIMAYAGLCGSSNLQNNSVDQFHVATYDEVIQYTQSGNGNSCPVLTPTNNDPPVVTVPASGFYIPYQTPFELTGSAADPQMDSLTYCWEQWDLGPSVHPDSAVGTAPLFRTWAANNSPTRICPRIEDLVTNTSTIGELLPQFGREMNFRLTVRDNFAGAGGVDYGQVTFQVADSAGPFAVVSPNGGQIWTGGTIETVTWDVANSDLAPVNCQFVDIYLSQDSGYTYPILLAANRPNTGSAALTVPNLSGNDYRVKVKAANNIFFDISNQNFIIQPAPAPDFTVTVNQPLQTICGLDTATYLIELDTLMNFSGNISLGLNGNPPGTIYSFDVNPSPTPGNVILTVIDTAGTASGNFTMTLQATGSTGIKNLPLQLQLRPVPVAAVSLNSPFNGATNVPGSSPFIWNPVPFAQSYIVEISETPTFSPLVNTASVTATSYTPSPSLNNNSVYYWRVKVDQSDCGSGPWSPIHSFQTELRQCGVYTSIDTPVVIPSSGTPTVYSQLSVTQSIILTDVNVLDLRGEHTWVSDLNFTLISPSGDSIFLFGGVCGSDDDFDLSFDDAATPGPIPCPPTSGLTYRPDDQLGTLIGSNAQGTWYMEVFDDYNQDGGSLRNWSLELCGPPVNSNAPLVNNNPLPVAWSGFTVVGGFYLNASCGTVATDVIYTITSLPIHGTLLLNGTPVSIGDTFTQADVNAGLLEYNHNGSMVATDQFGYTVTCLNGGYVGGLVLPIDVLLISGLEAEAPGRLELFPNPAQEDFRLRYNGSVEDDKEVIIHDAMGRIVMRSDMPESEWSGSVAQLPAGIYLVEVVAGKQRLAARRLLVTR